MINYFLFQKIYTTENNKKKNLFLNFEEKILDLQKKRKNI